MNSFSPMICLVSLMTWILCGSRLKKFAGQIDGTGRDLFKSLEGFWCGRLNMDGEGAGSGARKYAMDLFFAGRLKSGLRLKLVIDKSESFR